MKHEVCPIFPPRCLLGCADSQQTDEDTVPSFDVEPDLGTHSENDLSNRKLAQNQMELSRQISELRNAVEVQGEMIRHLVGILEGASRGVDGVIATETGVGKDMWVGNVTKGKGREGLNSHPSLSWSMERIP